MHAVGYPPSKLPERPALSRELEEKLEMYPIPEPCAVQEWGKSIDDYLVSESGYRTKEPGRTFKDANAHAWQVTVECSIPAGQSLKPDKVCKMPTGSAYDPDD